MNITNVQGEKISKAGLAAPGMILLVGGLVTIAFNGQAASSRRAKEAEAEQGETFFCHSNLVCKICISSPPLYAQ